MGKGILTRQRVLLAFFFLADIAIAFLFWQSVFHIFSPLPLLIFPVTLTLALFRFRRPYPVLLPERYESGL